MSFDASNTSSGIQKERYSASLARLYDIFKGISETTNQVSSWRCPYKNAQDRCTAGFGCRNQLQTGLLDELSICTGSDALDYRDAWDIRDLSV